MIILLSICLIIFIIGGSAWANKQEIKDFNNGFCPRCGTKLRHFDDDSQGGQGFTCDRCGYTTWISWFKVKEE